jgi:hypothetical protein
LDRFSEVENFGFVRLHINKNKHQFIIWENSRTSDEDEDFQVSFLKKSYRKGENLFFLS